MSRFDVFAGNGTGGIDYLLDVQANALTDFPTLVVVPLIHDVEARPFRGLKTVLTRKLGAPVLSLDDRSADICEPSICCWSAARATSDRTESVQSD